MPFDLCYVIALPSRMRVIPLLFLPWNYCFGRFSLHHTLATSGTVGHAEDCHVHVHMVPLNHYRTTDGPHKELKLTYGGPRSPCTFYYIWSCWTST